MQEFDSYDEWLRSLLVNVILVQCLQFKHMDPAIAAELLCHIFDGKPLPKINFKYTNEQEKT